jgi:hypothetical protein
MDFHMDFFYLCLEIIQRRLGKSLRHGKREKVYIQTRILMYKGPAGSLL